MKLGDVEIYAQAVTPRFIGLDGRQVNRDDITPEFLEEFCEQYKKDMFALYNLKPPGPTIKPAEAEGIQGNASMTWKNIGTKPILELNPMYLGEKQDA